VSVLARRSRDALFLSNYALINGRLAEAVPGVGEVSSATGATRCASG
jgi:hypothetical protein